MISLLHLIWIVPVSATIGLVTAVFCIEASRSDEELETIYGEAEWNDR